MSKKLVIFDLDGTLLNTIADLGNACNYALALHGFPIHSQDEYPLLVGNGINKLIERALPMDSKSEENILKIRADFMPYYDLHNRDLTMPYEGMKEVLTILKANNWLLAVASNKYQSAAKEITEHYFPCMFDSIHGEKDGIPRKPDPAIVANILNELQVDLRADTVYYIGDSNVDIQTARNANVECIACSWGFCKTSVLQQHSPQHLIHKPIQILDILCK